MINKIKWAYQRVVRGYDDRIYWDFELYLNNYIVPALKTFCKKGLKDGVIIINKKSKSVFKKTLKLIDKLEKSSLDNEYKASEALWKYIGENISCYWD